MVQFRYSRLYLRSESVSCRLLQRMASMEMDLNLNTLGHLFQVLIVCCKNQQKML